MTYKVAVIYGTRPEVVKLAPIARLLARHPQVAYVGINTGQHRELMPTIMQGFGVPQACALNLMHPGQSLLELESRILSDLPPVLVQQAPDIVIVQGDTATAAMAAWAAFHLDIPVAHVEAGLRTYRPHSPFPEETLRRTIATFSSWNFAPSAHAAENLKREAAPGRTVITGNPVVDALHEILSWPAPDSGPPKAKRFRVVATIHRRENHPHLKSIFEALARVARQPNIELLIPLHPNPVVVAAARQWLCDSPVQILEPMDYPTWIHVMRTADVLVSDSGGIQEEAPVLGVPLLVVREETERPEVIWDGHARLVGHDAERIVAAVNDTLSGHLQFRQGSPYGDGKAAERIIGYLFESSI